MATELLRRSHQRSDEPLADALPAHLRMRYETGEMCSIVSIIDLAESRHRSIRAPQAKRQYVVYAAVVTKCLRRERISKPRTTPSIH